MMRSCPPRFTAPLAAVGFAAETADAAAMVGAADDALAAVATTATGVTICGTMAAVVGALPAAVGVAVFVPPHAARMLAAAMPPIPASAPRRETRAPVGMMPSLSGRRQFSGHPGASAVDRAPA